MGWVNLAMVKILSLALGLEEDQSIWVLAGLFLLTVVYTLLAGLIGVVFTDFLQFAGRVKLDAQPRDLVRIVTELRDFFHPQCDQHDIVLRTQLPDQPISIRVDESLLKQALLNLLVNARQVLSEGGTVGVRTRAGSRGEVVVEVEDDGPGIPAEMRERIFEVFYSSRGGGTGLGLPIARQVVAAARFPGRRRSLGQHGLLPAPVLGRAEHACRPDGTPLV